MNKLFLIVVIATLAACSSVPSETKTVSDEPLKQKPVKTKGVSDEILKEKAAFALNTTPDSVEISNRRTERITTRFVATVGENSHQCYVTHVRTIMTGRTVSDAICSGSNSVKSENKPCNDLLRAANRC